MGVPLHHSRRRHTMARYMLIMRVGPEAEAAMAEQEIDFDQVIESMGRFNEELIKAGVLLAGEGLTGPEEGFVVDFNSDPPVVTDGPYTEAKELFNGFWILDVSSKEEAKQWAKKVPLGPGVKLEVRRVSETEEFPQDNPWVQKEIRWKAELAEKLAAQARADADKLGQ
ncbi:DGPFAETKE family protein [Mycolicibacterium monacense DSM 44395]|nr:DGPFAETKE family protein [Mycolicibacterium monacense DSM 44395]